jgi:hypothetical protein
MQQNSEKQAMDRQVEVGIMESTKLAIEKSKEGLKNLTQSVAV